jgi:hypothetical protein
LTLGKREFILLPRLITPPRGQRRGWIYPRRQKGVGLLISLEARPFRKEKSLAENSVEKAVLMKRLFVESCLRGQRDRSRSFK